MIPAIVIFIVSPKVRTRIPRSSVTGLDNPKVWP